MAVWIDINRWQHYSFIPLYLSIYPQRQRKVTLAVKWNHFESQTDACGHLQLVVCLCFEQSLNVPFYLIKQNNHINLLCHAGWQDEFFYFVPFSTCTCDGLLSRSLSSQHHSSSAGVKVKDLLTWPPRIIDCGVAQWECTSHFGCTPLLQVV